MHIANPKELTKFKEMQGCAFPTTFSAIGKPLNNRPVCAVDYLPSPPGSVKALPRALPALPRIGMAICL